MSEKVDRDDAIVKLEYLNLRTNLLGELNSMIREYHMLADEVRDSQVEDEFIEKDRSLLADRRTYLTDIAKQGLTSDDYAHFKDLVDNFKIGFWKKKGLGSKVTKAY